VPLGIIEIEEAINSDLKSIENELLSLKLIYIKSNYAAMYNQITLGQ